MLACRLPNNGARVSEVTDCEDKMHAQLSADLVVSDPHITVLVDGSGNCIEIEEGIVAIGSGGLYA